MAASAARGRTRTRAALVTLLVAVAALVTGGGVAVVAAADGSDGQGGQGAGYRTDDALVTVRTGPHGDRPVRLDTRLYLPSSATADRPAPAVLLAHGLGGTKDSVAGQARDLVRRGYVVLTWTAEGFGASGGQIHLDSPDWEVTDARRLLDRLARRPEVRRDGPGDPRVGVVGASYGGALALLVAGYDRRVDAIVPQVTWNDLGNALAPEATGRGSGAGVLKRAWAGRLFAAGIGSATGAPADCGRYAENVCRTYQRLILTGRVDPITRDLLARSSPASVLHRITAPTLLIQGTADTLFPLSEADANAIGIAKAGTRVRVAWFSGGHDGGAGADLDQRRVKAATLGWLDYHLRHEGSPPPDSFAFSRVTGTGYGGDGVRVLGLYADSYPRLDGDRPARNVKLRGSPRAVSNPPAGTPAAVSSIPGLGSLAGSLLSQSSGASSSRSPSDPSSGSSADSPLAGALGSSLTTDVPGQFVSYDSAPLTAPADVTGAPTVRIRAASRSGSAVLFVKLYDVAPSGARELPGGGVAPVRLSGLPASIEEARPVSVTLPGIVHRFPAGHRLRVTLATTDQAYAGPAQPQVYTVGLAPGSGIQLPQVAAFTATDSTGPWVVLLGAVVAALAVVLPLGWWAARRRSRRRVRRVMAEYAEVPLVVRGVTKTYADGLTALDGVDFTVRRGEVVGLLGPNGAGKTSCLRILLGLVRPTAGEALVFGHRVGAGAPALSRVGALVEGPGFLPDLSGRANLELFWQATGRAPGDAHLDEVLAIAALGPALNRKVRTYSHGMRQRLAIAQAMLGLPDLLILDEPTDGLDPPQIATLRRTLRAYTAGGRAVLVSSHLLAEVERTCSHVVVLHRGRLLAAGAVASVVGDSPNLEDVFLTLVEDELPAGDLVTTAEKGGQA
ncbi:ABC-2 type transport system ATP-binding protein [Actinopolymorpha cephalotaxi]|uniref:ABC-2 type transport system ATP-binding protein n=1 Tax=Actinopolymorpha cephalotaxi TaxID=504797 RepID=A0A1I2UDF2_9ACTN|nr:alpha/beta fold hydrolase [Actinopolymorpha cephalotaxi]NYH86541.1 ABC-2 type transport system ATP-binding protein [Actinopolymorpha cephalotaxi]SFG75043.1 ABC-2 type transport system ATP-binding protein [Actinopolymorpha cephalotaxi]